MPAPSQHHWQWLLGVSLLTLMSLMLVCGLIVAVTQIWLPRAEILATDKLEMCAGLPIGGGQLSVWWSSPVKSAVTPRAYASRLAVCGYLVRPPFLVQQGSWPYPQLKR